MVGYFAVVAYMEVSESEICDQSWKKHFSNKNKKTPKTVKINRAVHLLKTHRSQQACIAFVGCTTANKTNNSDESPKTNHHPWSTGVVNR